MESNEREILIRQLEHTLIALQTLRLVKHTESNQYLCMSGNFLRIGGLCKLIRTLFLKPESEDLIDYLTEKQNEYTPDISDIRRESLRTMYWWSPMEGEEMETHRQHRIDFLIRVLKDLLKEEPQPLSS